MKITEEMKKRAEENRQDLEGEYLDDKDYAGVDFCNTFGTNGNFDVRGGDSDPMLMYVGGVCGMTVVVDGNVWRSTAEEFLDCIESMENRLEEKNEELKKLKDGQTSLN